MAVNSLRMPPVGVRHNPQFYVVRPHAHDGTRCERLSLREELVNDAVPDVDVPRARKCGRCVKGRNYLRGLTAKVSGPQNAGPLDRRVRPEGQKGAP